MAKTTPEADCQSSDTPAGLLPRTFVHFPGIGYVSERRLWERGLQTWADLIAAKAPVGGYTAERWALMRELAANSQQSLQAGDHRHFAASLATRDHWRAFPEFRSRTLFVDIETNGGMYANAITVVGVYDGLKVRQYVRGDNLADFPEELEQAALLVTFNGTTFDLPLLRRAFPGACWEQLHVDLRFTLRSLGLRGGLKSIEQQMGIRRQEEVRGLGGEDAIWLWQQYRRGSSAALETLLAYNAADIENLEILLDLAWPQLRDRLEGEVSHD